MNYALNDLPAGPYRDILMEAARRGKLVLPPMGVDPGSWDHTSLFLAGLADIIAEMRQQPPPTKP